jgi:hypothetical protein
VVNGAAPELRTHTKITKITKDTKTTKGFQEEDCLRALGALSELGGLSA